MKDYSEFRLLLRDQIRVREERITFFVNWVRKAVFENKLKDPRALTEEICRGFPEKMGASSKFADWQVDQARYALSLYFEHFVSPHQSRLGREEFGWGDVAVRLRDIMRVKKLSPRTEATYWKWIRQFRRFVQDKALECLGVIKGSDQKIVDS